MTLVKKTGATGSKIARATISGLLLVGVVLGPPLFSFLGRDSTALLLLVWRRTHLCTALRWQASLLPPCRGLVRMDRFALAESARNGPSCVVLYDRIETTVVTAKLMPAVV
jgi:hypothetical protein